MSAPRLLVIDDDNCVPFAEFIPLPHFGGNDDPPRRIELCVVSTRFLPFHILRAVPEAMGFSFDTARIQRPWQALIALPRHSSRPRHGAS